MLNLNKFCSLFIGLILSVVCALPLSARDINVRGTVTNIEGEPLFRVSIYNAGTNKLIGSTNEDGKYLVKIDSEGELLFTSLGYEECKAAVRGELTVDVGIAIVEQREDSLNYRKIDSCEMVMAVGVDHPLREYAKEREGFRYPWIDLKRCSCEPNVMMMPVILWRNVPIVSLYNL